MDYKTVILSLSYSFGEDLTREILKYLRGYTEEQGHGCITCNISWHSILNNSLKPLCNSYLYPVIIWHIGYFDIGYACSRKCKKIYEMNDLLIDEINERTYYVTLENNKYKEKINKFYQSLITS